MTSAGGSTGPSPNSRGLSTADEIALLEKLLAEKRAVNQNAGQLFENPREGTDDGTCGKESDMCRIDGPFKHHNKWRVRVVDRESKRTRRYNYETENQARAAIPKLRREYSRPVGVLFAEALQRYEKPLATRGNVPSRGPNKPRTIETTMGRLRAVFATELVTGELTSAKMIELWQRWVTGKATDTALNTLAQVRTFLAWLKNREWLTGKDVVGGVEVLGKRRKGKPKLTYDEAKKLVAWCLDRPTDPGAWRRSRRTGSASGRRN
jgi:hypothetical protein